MVGAFTCVNVALSDLDNPSRYYYLEANLKSPGVMPTSQWLRSEYLPKVFDYHVAGGKKKLAGTISVSVVCDERGSAQDYYVLDALAIPSLNRDVNILSNQVKQVSKLFYWNMFFWKPQIIKPFLKLCCKYYKSFPVQSIYGQKLLSETSAGKKENCLPFATQFSGLVSNLHPKHCSFQALSTSENVANECTWFVRFKCQSLLGEEISQYTWAHWLCFKQ